MSKVAALNVQSVIRPTTGRPVAPVTAPKRDAAPKVVAAPTLAPEAQAFAAAALTALIQAQARAEPVASRIEQALPVAKPVIDKVEEVVAKVEAAFGQAVRRGDPQPTHGHDDEHGHKPADPPPVVTPPVVAPPVADPPVSVDPPPVTPAPLPMPPRVDPSVAPRLQAILNQTLVERDAIRQSTAAFIAFAAERQAFAAINRNGVATALLQGFNTYA